MNEKPSHRPWRTLIRVDDVGESFADLIVPAWDSQCVIRLTLADIPANVRERIDSGQKRFHAEVNIGAEDTKDLYIINWEDK